MRPARRLSLVFATTVPAAGVVVTGCVARPDADVGVFEQASDPSTVVEGGVVDASGPPVPPQDAGSEAWPYVYDPTVVFDWPESDGATRGACLPGTYTGDFYCEFATGGWFPSSPVTGPITLELVESTNGEFLEIQSGRLEGTVGIFAFASDLSGRLDCVSSSLTAEAYNGSSTAGVTFSGTLEGTLDRATQTLEGIWALAPTGASPCVGTWSVSRSP